MSQTREFSRAGLVWAVALVAVAAIGALLQMCGTFGLGRGVAFVEQGRHTHAVWALYAVLVVGVAAWHRIVRIPFPTVLLAPLACVGLAALSATGAELIRPRLQAGDGLRAEFYANPDLAGPPIATARGLAVGIANPIGPWPRRNPDVFSVRWTGYLTVASRGLYTFVLTSDDGSQLFIDNGRAPVIDNSGQHGPVALRGSVELSGGSHLIELRYSQLGGEAALDWSWTSGSGAVSAIPGWRLSQRATTYAVALGARLLELLRTLMSVVVVVAAAWSVMSLRQALDARREPMADRRTAAYAAFAGLLFIVCLTLSSAIPPLQSPDEDDHVKRAYLLTKGHVLLEARQGEGSGGMVDAGLLDYMRVYEGLQHRTDVKVSAAQAERGAAIRWTGTREFSPAPGTGYYLPVLYAPQAMALALGERLGYTVETSYTLARLCALTCSCLLIFAAFVAYPPPLLAAALLLLPISLFQMASASLDGIANAMTLLAVALFMRLTDPEREARPELVLLLGLVVLLLAGSRVHLAPLVLLVFATRLRVRGALSLAVGGVVVVGVLAWTLMAVMTTIDKRFIHEVGTSAVLAYYLRDPAAFFTVLSTTLHVPGIHAYYLETFIGNLGWLDAPLRPSSYVWFDALLLLIMPCSLSFDALRRQWPERALLLLCATASVVLIFFALLVSWNVHPAVAIRGVQGRYFFGPALLVAYALESRSGMARVTANRIGLALVLCLLCYSTVTTTDRLITRYYQVP